MKEQGEEPPLPNILFTVLAAIRNPLALEDRFPAKVLAFKKRVNIWLGGKGKTNRLCWLPGFSCADDSLDEICWFAGQSCQNASLKAVSGRGAQCMYGFGPMGVRQD